MCRSAASRRDGTCWRTRYARCADMAQTKKKRKRKHRGTPAGTVERPARSAKPQTREEAKKAAKERRSERLDRPPTWQRGGQPGRDRSGRSSALLVVLIFREERGPGGISRGLHVRALHPARLRHRLRHLQVPPATSAGNLRTMDVRMFTVGPVQENCFLDQARWVRPRADHRPGRGGSEAARRHRAARRDARRHPAHPHALRPRGGRGRRGEGHGCGGVGARAWRSSCSRTSTAGCPRGFGPFESWDAEHTLAGGERLELAGFEIDVIFTPGHSPGHVSYSIADEEALFSGDVLFKGSVGPHGPSGRRLADAARVDPVAGRDACPARRPSTRGTWASRRLGAERASNPFLAELARQ